MDPQSQSFTPYSSNTDTWRLQSEVTRLQQTQSEHADRLTRLERRQEDDARLKSVWGTQSPFPSVLSGTPQQAPLQHPATESFRGFENDSNALISSLHLDPEDEPRRGMGATSRANSVRFDESANQNHFSHSSRNSMEFMRGASGGGLGGLRMDERTSSHKSDGRASSAHSIRSAASGRASSLNLDTGYGTDNSGRSPQDTPGIAPGLLLLGSVPAIIRCWMNTNFKHDALLYAALCTGSYKSYLDIRLIQKLGFEAQIRVDEAGGRRVDLPVYFPEAVPYPASSRSSSPAPQLPTIAVDFHVAEHNTSEPETKSIQIFLGADVLRAHSADILFSSNSVTLFDDDQSKLSIPLVRPESEATFNSLRLTSDSPIDSTKTKDQSSTAYRPPFLNGITRQNSSNASLSSRAISPSSGRSRAPLTVTGEAEGALDAAKPGTAGSDSEGRPASRASVASRPSLSLLGSRPDTSDQAAETPTESASSRAGGTPAIWNSWRKDTVAPAASPRGPGLDWAGASKGRLEPTYQRKDTGIKVLKPKTAARSVSTTVATSNASISSPSESRSRFFDEGRRRSGPLDVPADLGTADARRESAVPPSTAPIVAAGGTIKSKSNPIGGGSAFSWLNSGNGPK